MENIPQAIAQSTERTIGLPVMAVQLSGIWRQSGQLEKENPSDEIWDGSSPYSIHHVHMWRRAVALPGSIQVLQGATPRTMSKLSAVGTFLGLAGKYLVL